MLNATHMRIASTSAHMYVHHSSTAVQQHRSANNHKSMVQGKSIICGGSPETGDVHKELDDEDHGEDNPGWPIILSANTT